MGSLEPVFKSLLVTLTLVFWSSLYLVFKLKIKPMRVERLPRKPRPDYLSKETIKRVLEAEEHCKATKESCDWLNLVIKWLFAELAGFPVNQARFNAFFEDMVLNFRRSRSMGPYITGTKLIDFDLGQRVPVFKNARVILEPTEELPLTALVMDMKYEGGLLGIAKLDLIGGWQVYLRGRLCDLSGPLYLMIRGTDLFYAMGRFDELKIRCQIVINGVQFRWLNWLASRLILPEFLRYKLAFPAMKAKYLAAPEDLQRILSAAAPSLGADFAVK